MENSPMLAFLTAQGRSSEMKAGSDFIVDLAPIMLESHRMREYIISLSRTRRLTLDRMITLIVADYLKLITT